MPLHPAYRARFADGSGLDVHSDAEAMEAEVERFAGAGAADGYRRLRAWLGELYRLQMRRFIDVNFDSPRQLLHPDLVRLAALGGFGRLDARIARYLPDERLRRVFSFQSLYAGVPPERALAAYAVIAYMDTVGRGSGSRAAGCTRCPAPWRPRPATREPSCATGSRSPGWSAPVNASPPSSPRPSASPATPSSSPPDLPLSYALLGHRPRRALRLRHAPSAVVLHVGTDRTWPGLGHHTLSFGSAWRCTFRELTRDGSLMTDPSLLITRPHRHGPGAGAARPPCALRAGALPQHRHRPRRPPVARPGPAVPRRAAGPPGAARTDRYRRRGAGGGAGHARRLERARARRRYTVLGRPHGDPDRTLPAPQPRARHPQRRAGRLRHHPRSRRTDRAAVRKAPPPPASPAPRPARHAAPARPRPSRDGPPRRTPAHDGTRTRRSGHQRPRPAGGVPALPPAQRPAREDLLPRHPAAAPGTAPRGARALRLRPLGRRHRGRPGQRRHPRRTRRGARRPGDPPGRRAANGREQPARRPRPRTHRRHLPHQPRPLHRLHGLHAQRPGGHGLSDLRRPAPLHARLRRRHRTADAPGARHRRAPGGGGTARGGAGRRLPADQLRARRRRGPRPRPRLPAAGPAGGARRRPRTAALEQSHRAARPPHHRGTARRPRPHPPGLPRGPARTRHARPPRAALHPHRLRALQRHPGGRRRQRIRRAAPPRRRPPRRHRAALALDGLARSSAARLRTSRPRQRELS